MNRNREIKLGIILSYISKFIQIFVGLIYTPIMIRILGQTDYGIYNVASSIVSYLGVLNFGFGSAYVRFYSRFKVESDTEKIASLNGMFLQIFLFLGMLAIISGLFFVINIEFLFGSGLNEQDFNNARIVLLILVINLAISFLGIIFNTFIIANERFVVINIFQILKQVTTPLLTIPILLSGGGSIGMVLIIALVNILTEILLAIFCFIKQDMKFSFSNFDKNLFKEMTVYSFYIFINMVVSQVNNNVDKNILGILNGPISVAIYSVGGNLVNYYIQISTSISDVFTPRIHQISSRKNSNEELSNLFIKVGRIQFSVLSLFCLGFIFFGKYFIEIWAGNDYSQSYYIAVILMISITIPLIQNIGIEVQRAKNMHKFRSWLYLFMAIGNIMLSIPLAKLYGGIGTSIGTAISYIVGNGLMMNYYYHKKIDINITQFWKSIVDISKGLIIPIIVGVIIIQYDLTYNMFSYIILLGIFTIIYFFSLWFFGFNKEEKNILTSLLKKGET